MTIYWCVTSLILGLCLVDGVVAGSRMSRRQKQATPAMQPNPFQDTGGDTDLPGMNGLLDRQLAMRHRMEPKKKNLKPQRLMRRMGRDFDPFWMSQTRPEDFSKLLTKNNADPRVRDETASLDLRTLAKNLLANLEDAGNSLYSKNSDYNITTTTIFNINATNYNATDPNTTEDVMSKALVDGLRSWLVRKGSCPVYYKWQDLGALYWPRWVRAGSCSKQTDENPFERFIRSNLSNNTHSNNASSTTTANTTTTTTTTTATTTTAPPPTPSSTSCSWPEGMLCVPGKEKKIRLLRWTCKKHRQSHGFHGKANNSRRHGRKHKPARHGSDATTHSNYIDDVIEYSHGDDHSHGLDFNLHHNYGDFPYPHHHDDDDHSDGDDHRHHQDFENWNDDNRDDGGDNDDLATKQLLDIFSIGKPEEGRSPGGLFRHQFDDKDPVRGQTETDAEVRDDELGLGDSLPSSKLVKTTPSWLNRVSRARSNGHRIRRASGKGRRSEARQHHRSHSRHGKSNRRFRKRKSDHRCRWVKMTHLVVDDCYCSC